VDAGNTLPNSRHRDTNVGDGLLSGNPAFNTSKEVFAFNKYQRRLDVVIIIAEYLCKWNNNRCVREASIS